MADYAIDISGLNKVYSTGNFPALTNINLKIPRNSIFGLLGPNGAGKSTLINILAGMVVKTSGKIDVLGLDFDNDPTKIKYLLGVVPQEIALDTFFDIQSALDFYSGYFGIRPDKRRIPEILKALGLIDKLHNTPRMLSGGMKRRLLIAKAMVHWPPILILDEPTAGVDINLREQLWHYILELKNQGTTIILTTHYLAEAQELCDEIAFIDKGQIIRADKKDNLLNEIGSKKLIIECTNLDSNIFNASIPNALVNDYKLQDNKITIDINHDQNINSLLQEVFALRVDIKNIYIERYQLEDIYKKYVDNIK
jgi:ABC-2 type transport system ATP-binding protein